MTIWYPALNPDCVEERFTYQQEELDISWLSPLFSQDGRAIRNAVPDTDDGPHPLVIYSHGGWSHPWTAHYLTEQLASRGYVVMAPVHEDNPFLTNLYRGLVSRPQDISRLIDYAEEITLPGESFAGVIDTEHVAVVGHSYGGITAMLAAGARFNLGLWKQSCPTVTNDVLLMYCSDLVSHEQQIAQLIGTEPPLDVLPSHEDARVDAAVSLASGQNYDAEGLQHVTVPTLLLAGSDDPLAPAQDARFIYGRIGSAEKALIVFENAGHGLFTVSCQNPPFTRSTSCNYDLVWDMDHAHDLINHFVTAFLEVFLKGNDSARRFLQSTGADFQGVDFVGTVASQ